MADATLTTSLAGRALGFALRAAGASEGTAGPAARAAAFANLQRLRHLLEDRSEGGPAHPAHVPSDILVRILELIAAYTHGTRMLNRDVDADAVRITIMLFRMGGVEALAERQCGLLESYGAVFSARARARPRLAAEAKHWKTSAFLCDLCGMAVAVMAVEVVRLQQSSNAVLRTRVAPVGRTLHSTMSALSDRGKTGKNDAKTNLKHTDTISILDKVQVAYMRVLRPEAWYSRVGGSGRWVAVAIPAMLAAGVWYEGGWGEFRRNDNGVLTIIGVLLLLCSTLPWVAPWLLQRDHGAVERAARVSGMLVEMAMYLRPAGGADECAGGSGSGGGTTAVWGEYMFGVFDEVGSEAGGSVVEEGCRGAEGHTGDEAGDREGDVRAMLASVRGLGDLVVHAIKADKTGVAMGAPALPAEAEGEEEERGGKEEEEVLQREDGNLSVQVPFPPEMLEKMVTLEKMLREKGGAPEEIAKAAERVQLLKSLLERG